MCGGDYRYVDGERCNASLVFPLSLSEPEYVSGVCLLIKSKLSAASHYPCHMDTVRYTSQIRLPVTSSGGQGFVPLKPTLYGQLILQVFNRFDQRFETRCPLEQWHSLSTAPPFQCIPNPLRFMPVARLIAVPVAISLNSAPLSCISVMILMNPHVKL